MNMKFFLSTIFLLIALHVVVGRVLNQCQLAAEMSRLGINNCDLPNYVCIAERESHGNTSAWRGPGRDGSYDWGLFLVSDNWWCGRGFPGGECQLSCSDLITDDISSAVRCAQIVVQKQGFSAWQSWSKFCLGHLPDLSQCFQ